MFTRQKLPWLILFALVCAALGVANQVYGWGVGGWLTAAFFVLPVVAESARGLWGRSD